MRTIARVGSGIKSFLKALYATRNARFAWGIFLFILALGFYEWALETWQEYSFTNLSPAEHLVRAKEACAGTVTCADPAKALHHLRVIQAYAPEHTSAQEMIKQIELQRESEFTSAWDRAKEKMEANFRGEAHDKFDCAVSKDQRPMVSFDGRTTWWWDDGRCSAVR